MVPNGWRKVAIEDVAKVIRGSSPRPKGDPRYYGGTIPRLMGADVTRDGKYVTPKIDFLTEEGAKLSRPVPAGTMTVVCSGDVGVPSFLAVDACIHDGFLALLDITDDCDKDFLFCVLSSLTGRLERSATHGGVFTNLTTTILKEFTLNLPPLPEQKRIAAILSTWDRAIELTEKLIEAKQKRKEALVHSLITEPLWAMRHDKQISGWKETRLSTLIEKRTHKSSDIAVFPLHSFTIEDGVTPKTERYERSFLLKDSENNEYSVVSFGDFVINPMNLRFGAIGRSRIQKAVSVSAYYDVFHVVDAACDSGFLEHVLKSPLLMYTYETVATGSLVEKKRVHFSEFVKISISLPSLNEQVRIASIIDCQDYEIELLLKKIVLLKEQKKGLMQQLLTGKVRVKVDAETVKG